MPKCYCDVVVVEAFKMGRDVLPKWFFDLVNKQDIILQADYQVIFCKVRTGNEFINALWGDYLVKLSDGSIHTCSHSLFEKLFSVIPGQVPDRNDL